MPGEGSAMLFSLFHRQRVGWGPGKVLAIPRVPYADLKTAIELVS
jgi:hypothetical protein